MWDQIRVDYGREWFLMLSVQQALAGLRNNVAKTPYIQTSSKKVSISTVSKLFQQTGFICRTI